MAFSGDYRGTFGASPAVGGYGLAGAGQAAAQPSYAQRVGQQIWGGAAAPTTPNQMAAQPAQTYAQKVAQQYAPQQPGRAGGYNYNPGGYGLAGAGQQWGQQARPAAVAPAPAAARPAPITTGTPSAPGATTNNPGGSWVSDGQGGKTWIPSITQTTTLSPTEQGLLEQQQGLQKQFGTLGSTLAGNIPTTPMSFANAPAMPTAGGYNQQSADAVMQQQKAYLDPQWNVQEQQLKDQMRDQGIPEGSAAYNQQMDQFNRQRTFAYQQAQDSAIQEGYNVAQQQFGQGMSARQQGVSEAQNLYNQPTSTLGNLMAAYGGTGGINVPQAQYQPASIAPTNIGGIVGQQGQLQNAAYQNQANQYASNVGGISGLAGMLALGAGL